jgi:phosphotriesterase-related protein
VAAFRWSPVGMTGPTSSEVRSDVTVQTVLGPIAAGELGTVLSHEHVLISIGEDARHYPWLFDWEQTRALAIDDLRRARVAGVDTIIDLTTPDLGRDVAYVRDVALASGMQVVVATGMWLVVPPSFWDRDLDEIADIFVREIEIGIDGTDIKAGVIKVASDTATGGVTAHSERILRGAARALKRTGCPISTHQSAQERLGERQVEILQEEGAPMDRVCIGHSADTTDIDYLESLLHAGVFLSMDRFPEDASEWRARLATIRALVDRGWAHRLMLGDDESPTPIGAGRPPAERTGPAPYTFIGSVAVPALRADGVSEDAIDAMLRRNPVRFLSGEAIQRA